MGRYSRKTKEIISAILVFALVVASISGVVALATKTEKKISPGVFSRGALDGSGKFVDTDTCLYTQDLIQCRGLTVSVDFEAALEYEIYFYRADESFIGSTGRLTDDFYIGDDYKNAKYCRIVIIPVLKDGSEKIHFWEVYSYAKQITVKVSKDQRDFDLNGVTVSILGDGISSYSGWSDNFTMTSPTIVNRSKYDETIMPVDSTWWMQMVAALDLTLCVNNSCDLSYITDQDNYTALNRYSFLECDSHGDPDIIIIYLGSEDVSNLVPLYYTEPGDTPDDEHLLCFANALGELLYDIKYNFRNSDVFICTLLPGDHVTDTDLVAYNDVIRSFADSEDFGLIDLFTDSGITGTNYQNYMLEDYYPNEAGMELIARTVTDTLITHYNK